ncbi:MAG: YfhO family protein, partial [Oscillospiraceae bacterium]
LDIDRSVNSAPEMTRYALRALTRVKYIMFPEDMDEEDRQATLDELEIYEYMETQSGYDIYKTEYALPMGFAYDTYVSEDIAKNNGAADKLMVRSVILNDEQAERLSDILTELPEASVKVTTLERFKEDAAERIAEGVLQFGISSEGFSAITGYDTEKLVMFTVPFDKGWSASVSGVPVDIEKVNGGFMAIRVPAGVQEIEFTYRTPGLTLGIILTIVGILLTAAYILFFRFVVRKPANPYAHLYGQQQVEGVKAHSSYIAQLSKQIYECRELEAPRKGETPAEDAALLFPDREDIFMEKRVEAQLPPEPERTSKLMESDEAYKVLAELDEKKRRESDDDIIE